jgi:hypothetical protein
VKTSEVLNRAADLIEERGWAKGPLAWGDDGAHPLCLEGGIIAALGGKGWKLDRAWQEAFWTCPAYQSVAAYVDHDVSFDQSTPKQPLWEFNDDHSAAEVIEVLRACAVIEQAREEQDAAWATYAELVTA